MRHMQFTRLVPGILLAGLVAGGTPALAHGPGRGGIQGTVTGIGANDSSLQVQTQTGSVTVGLTGSTRVIRDVAGSTADLVKNARVELQLASGTTTVNAVVIDTITPAPKSGTAKPAHTPLATKPTHSGATTTKPVRTTPVVRNHVQGTIVSVQGQTVTIQYRTWNSQTKTLTTQTASYTLASNATITKVVSGQLSDLSVGESVRVVVGRTSNTALLVTILNA